MSRVRVLLSGLSTTSDSPQKLLTPMQTPTPSVDASPKINGTSDFSPCVDSPLRMDHKMRGGGILDEDIMIVEKSDDSVSSIKLDNRTISGSLENNNANDNGLMDNSYLDVCEINGLTNTKSNSDRIDYIDNRADLGNESFVNRDVVSSKGSSNSSLADSPRTGSERESSPNDLQVNDEPEPLSLVFDDPTDADDLQPNLDDDFYDYDKLNDSLERDSRPADEAINGYSEDEEQILTMTNSEPTEQLTISVKESKDEIVSPVNAILEQESNDTMDNVTSDFASFCISDDNNGVDANTEVEAAFESDKSDNLLESNTINSFADFSFEFDREPTEERSPHLSSEDLDQIVEDRQCNSADVVEANVFDRCEIGTREDETSRSSNNENSTILELPSKFETTEFQEFATSVSYSAVETIADPINLPDVRDGVDCDFSKIPVASSKVGETGLASVELSTDTPLPLNEPGFVDDSAEGLPDCSTRFDDRNDSTNRFDSTTTRSRDPSPSQPETQASLMQEQSVNREDDFRKDEDDDDFGDFADFSNEPGGHTEVWAPNISSPKIDPPNRSNGLDDDFEDFGDFDSCVLPVEKPQISLKDSISRIENKNVSLHFIFYMYFFFFRKLDFALE